MYDYISLSRSGDWPHSHYGRNLELSRNWLFGQKEDILQISTIEAHKEGKSRCQAYESSH